MLPEKVPEKLPDDEIPTGNIQEECSMEDRLQEILSCIQSAGKVKVMLSISQSEKTIYQTDSTYSQSDDHADSRTQTILISDNQRNETGLVHQKHSPVYQGAIVLAEGADLASVKLAIVDAVSDITGLGADKISVLKMK
jgi:stage III sporulation protein AG